MSHRTSAGHPADTETVSDRNPSEGSKAVRQTDRQIDNNTTSSRSVALAPDTEGRDELAADLARLVCSLRPDWSWPTTRTAIRADDRPWRTVVLASIRGAALDGPDTIRHPNGLRYVNPDGVVATPTPPRKSELRCPCDTCQEAGR